LVTENFDEEQEAFQDAVHYVGMAWMQASRLRLRNLTPEQYTATSKLLAGFAGFTLALRSEFARQPPPTSNEKSQLRATPDAPRPAGRQTENPYDRVVTANSLAWAALSNLLSMPNRLNEEQRARAGDALAAMEAFIQTDFRGSIRMTDCEAA
jgi:hypothetical protein